MEVIKVVKAKFAGIYVSVWFNKKFCWYCKKRPATVIDKAPEYYIPLVFRKRMSLDDILEYIQEKIIKKYNTEIAKWDKSIHVKYFYQVVDENKRNLELWIEYNFNPDKGWHTPCKIKDIKCGDVLKVEKGFAYYKLPFRIIGSLFTMKFIILWSDSKYQYIALEKIN